MDKPSFSLTTIVSGERVSLRAPRASDAERIVELRKSSWDFLAPWEPEPARDAFDVQAMRARLLEQRREWQADRAYKFVVTLGPGGRGPIIGRVALSQVFRAFFQNAILGYWIGVDHARRGYMTEAVRLALDAAFGPIGLHRVEAGIMPQNAASLGVARKVGLRQEGRAERYLKIAGEYRDHLLFAITAEEWTRAPSGG